MDASLEQEGIRGRGGQPRNLVNLRLRLSERLLRTLAQLEAATVQAVTPRAAPTMEVAGSASADTAPIVVETVAQTIARCHRRDPDTLLEPARVEAESYLRAIIVTPDPRVTFDDRLRARRLLTQRARQRGPRCVCSATLIPQDDFEFRQWIDEVRASEPGSIEDDPYIATLVRLVAGGSRLEPWFRFQRTWYAIIETIESGADRIHGSSTQDPRNTGEDDPAIRRFWTMLLTRSTRVTAKQRLKAFHALDELGVLPRCTCTETEAELPELDEDLRRAWIIRSVGRRHYRAATAVAFFPETYHAVRDAIDAKVAAALDTGERPQVEPESLDAAS